MKRKIFLFVMMCALNFAHNAFAKEFIRMYFYGVDFSKCKVNGAQESSADFLDAFEKMNQLFHSEPAKYSLTEMTGKLTNQSNITPGLELSKLSNPDSIMVVGCNDVVITDEQLQSIISEYDFPHTEGVGSIVVAALLDKPKNKGKFYTCYFDLATKEIIVVTEAWCKSGGFGLRNFWASSMRESLKKQKKLLREFESSQR